MIFRALVNFGFFLGQVYSGPTDLISDLVSKVYKEHETGFDLNLAPYFSVSTFKINYFVNVVGYYKPEDELTKFRMTYGLSGSKFLMKYEEKLSLGGDLVLETQKMDDSNSDNGAQNYTSKSTNTTIHRISIEKDTSKSPTSWDFELFKTGFFSISGFCNYSLVHGGNWSNVNIEVSNADTASVAGQIHFSKICFDKLEECKLYGNLETTERSRDKLKYAYSKLGQSHAFLIALFVYSLQK